MTINEHTGDEPTDDPGTEAPRPGMPAWLWIPVLSLALIAILVIAGRDTIAL